ncbi:MAG TPA: cytochrome P460 family protein [Steroidobacteraceae bacterium]|jgi:hypothetical protein|nr:cytochrome P460 family protein [Steroidobacteraceae bacterium]
MARIAPCAIGIVVLAVAAIWTAGAAPSQDKYALKVPGGLAFADFKGYESWQVISVSQNGGRFAVILGNPAMIAAYQGGIPGNGAAFPDGARIAKIHWIPKKADTEPGQPLVPDTLHDVDFMVKDSHRYADSGGWGYAQFEYDPAAESFRPGTLTDSPPQANDARCGAACHTAARARNYVFTVYGNR